MYSFRNDYSEGAHPNIIRSLTENNFSQQDGYLEDDFCQKARELIYQKLRSNNPDIHFLTGGTQTNLTSMSAFLRPYEAIIAAKSAHICTHETGAIEKTGHRVLEIDTNNGKITKEQIKPILDMHNMEHMVLPRLVFISNATEVGTIYTKNELEVLSSFCREHNLYLYIDGARLGVSLASDKDISLADYARFCDAFYFGGTKNGALIGEALIICNENLKENFRYNLKQNGALLAKSRLLGIQFMELFKDDLYLKLAENSITQAKILTKGIKEAGFNFFVESPTNQIFPIFPKELIPKLLEKFAFYEWEPYSKTETVVRLVTSWATKQEEVERFLNYLNEIKPENK